MAKKLYSQKPYGDDVVFDIELLNGGLARHLKLNDSSDGVIMVEGHFKFFEVENLLRTICYDMFDPLRKRIVKETEAGR